MYGSIRHEPLTPLEAAAENDRDCVDGSLREVANLSCLVLGACEEGSTEAARRLLAGVSMWPGLDVDMAVQGILEPEAERRATKVLPPLPVGWRLCSWMEALSLSDPVATTPAPPAPASTPATTAQSRAEQEQPRWPRRHPFRRRRLPQRADALSLLYIACAHGHTAVVHLLLEAGADPELRVVCQGATETAVYVASQRGHFTALDVLLAHGADPNHSRGDDDTSPLYTACFHGHVACVKLLLASGADAGTCARDGTSALHAAYTGGSLQCVEALLLTGIDLIRCDPMTQARPRWCRGDFDVASAGSSPSVHDAVKCGGARCLRELLAAGAMTANADIPVPKNDDDDLNCLHLAVMYDEAECVQILLQHGVDPNQHHGRDGDVPLGLACLHGHVECAEFLLAANADPNLASMQSSSPLEHAVWTPLLIASWHGHTDVMRLLLDPRWFDAATSTGLPRALRAASRHGHVDVVGLIVALKGGVGTDAKGVALCDAIDDGHVEVVRALLRHGADPNKLVSWRSTQRTFVSWRSTQRTFGRDPKASQTMPLFLALDRQHTLCAMALLEFGATAKPPEGVCLSGVDRFFDGDASDQRDWVRRKVLSAIWNGPASFAVALLNAGALSMDLREALIQLINRGQHYDDSPMGPNLYLTLLQASLSTWRRQKWTDTMHELYDDPSVGVESVDELPELKATWQRLHAIHTERPKLWSPSQHRQFPPGFQAAVELVMRVAEYSRRAVNVRGHNHGLAIAGALPPELWHRIVRMLSCSAWPLLAKTVGGPQTPAGKQRGGKKKGGKQGQVNLEPLPSSAPFKAHVRNSKSLDLERIFFAEGLLVTSISKMHSGDAGGFCFVEFATQVDLRQALSLDGTTLLHHSLANPLDDLDKSGLLGEVVEQRQSFKTEVGRLAAEDEDYFDFYDGSKMTVDELRRMLKQTPAHAQPDWFGLPPEGRAMLRIKVAKPPTPKRVTRTTPSRSDSNWRAARTTSSARSHNTKTSNAPVAQRTRPRLNILPRTLPLHRPRPQPQP